MRESDFLRLGDQTLASLNRALDRVADEHAVDVLYQGGVLTLEIEEPRASKIVISPQSAVSQIWISAQATSFKLDWNPERGAFVFPPTGEILAALVGRLIGEDLGIGPVSL
jgi:CyaY protein